MSEQTRRQALKGIAASTVMSARNAQAATSPLCFLSAIEMAGLIRTKKLSAREALAAHLKQIELVNPKVNAMVTLVPEMAAEAAAKADEMQARGEKLGRLHGLPVAHKDLMDTRGIRTTYGSLLYKDHVPTEDDLVVERMRRAGAIIIGKTNTPEFGAGSQNVQQSLWSDAQSLRFNQDMRRIFWRRCCRAGMRIRARCQRIRYGWLTSESSGILQCCGVPSVSRPRPKPESRVCVVDIEHFRMPGTFRRGFGLLIEYDRGPRFPCTALH